MNVNVWLLLCGEQVDRITEDVFLEEENQYLRLDEAHIYYACKANQLQLIINKYRAGV